MKSQNFLFTVLFILLTTSIFAQTQPLTSVPFLQMSPFGFALGMSEINVVATSGNSQGSVEFNPAGMFESRMNVSVAYVPWGNVLDEERSNFTNLSGFYNLDDRHALGFYTTQFDIGSYEIKDAQGEVIGRNNPNESKFGIAYAYQPSKHFSLGLNVNYFHSILVSKNIVDARALDIQPGTGLTFGVGFLYKNDFSIANAKKVTYAIGLAVQDIGQKVSYVTNGNGDYIPTNLALGNTFGVKELVPNFDLQLATQFSKLLVPTPTLEDSDNNGIPDYNERGLFEAMTTSFNDAPDGFKEKIQEIMVSQTLEGVYHLSDNWQTALRLGYAYESDNKGARQYVQTGGQVKFKQFYGNIAYIFPTENSFLDNRFAFNIGYEVGL